MILKSSFSSLALFLALSYLNSVTGLQLEIRQLEPESTPGPTQLESNNLNAPISYFTPSDYEQLPGACGHSLKPSGNGVFYGALPEDEFLPSNCGEDATLTVVLPNGQKVHLSVVIGDKSSSAPQSGIQVDAELFIANGFSNNNLPQSCSLTLQSQTE